MILVVVREEEERKRIERALERKKAIYAVLSGTNRAIMTIRDRQELFEAVCKVALELAGFRLVWIGEISHDAQQRVVPVAVEGEARAHMADLWSRNLPLSAREDDPGGPTPTGIAARERRHVVVNDLSCCGLLPERARINEAYGLRSLMAMPIEGGDFVGTFTLCAGEVDYFEAEVIDLLLDVAHDLSFALNNIHEAENRARADAKLRLHAQMFEESRDGMLICDADNRIIMVNRSFSGLTGYAPEDVIGQNPGILKSGRHGRDFYLQMWAAINSGSGWQGEIWNRSKDGEICRWWLTISTVKDNTGKVVNYFAMFADLSERRAQEELNWLKRFDALTRLPNRVFLEDRVGTALSHARQHGRFVGLLSVNLNRFRYVNESMGHAAGDEVLRQVAARFTLSLGEGITVSRFSGDNFVVLAPDMDQMGEIIQVAEKILRVAEQVLKVNEEEIRLSASAGIAVFPQDGADFASLLKASDSALLRAREEGGNSFRFFTADLNESAKRALNLSTELHQALDNAWFELHYQPQVNAVTGDIIGVEALVRMRHPTRGLVSPAEFIPVAEETGMIVPLGAWVMREACRQMRAWHDAGQSHLTIAVNLSAKQFRDPQLHATIVKTLEATGLNPRALELEFTESAVMHNLDSTFALMRSLNKLGVRLAIDDFGTGYSSLSYLKQFPISRIKIDQSFVRGITRGVSDSAIVEAIIGLSRAMRLRTIAEGVETAEQVASLRVLHCDELQGYLFARPLPAEEVERLFGSKLGQG